MKKSFSATESTPLLRENTENAPLKLDTLPSDVLENIAFFLTKKDLFKLSQGNKQLDACLLNVPLETKKGATTRAAVRDYLYETEEIRRKIADLTDSSEVCMNTGLTLAKLAMITIICGAGTTGIITVFHRSVSFFFGGITASTVTSSSMGAASLFCCSVGDRQASRAEKLKKDLDKSLPIRMTR